LREEKQKRRATNAERIPFSPLYICRAALTSHYNLRAVAGKKHGRASENLKDSQAICGSEIPPCSPQRADLKELVFTFIESAWDRNNHYASRSGRLRLDSK
jgi:hypothetical protein